MCPLWVPGPPDPPPRPAPEPIRRFPGSPGPSRNPAAPAQLIRATPPTQRLRQPSEADCAVSVQWISMGRKHRGTVCLDDFQGRRRMLCGFLERIPGKNPKVLPIFEQDVAQP